MLRKEKTMGSRIASFSFAFLFLLSMLGDMEGLTAYAEELISATATEETVTESTSELPELLEIPAASPEDSTLAENDGADEETLWDESQFLNDGGSELTGQWMPTASMRIGAANDTDLVITSDSEYDSGTVEYYYQQYAEAGFLSSFTMQYVDIDPTKGETPYRMEKEDDFALQYEMAFHMGVLPIAAGGLKIKVPAKLFDFRDGTQALPYGGMSAKQIIFDNNGNMCETDGSPATTGGNDYLKIRYYEEVGEDGELYYVYTNIEPLSSSFGRTFTTVYPEMNVYDIVDGTTWNIDTKLSTTYTFDKYYVNPATGTANTALILVNGPEGEALYRVVGQNGGFEYYSLDKIDPNTGLLLTGTGTVPDYTQDVNGNFYKNNVPYDISNNPLAFKPQTFTTTLYATIPDLTGRVDTNATFDSISKVPLPKTTLDSSEYGPWIWNNAQANNFTGSGIDAKYFHQHEVENVPVEGGTEGETTTIKENDYLLLGWQINVKKVRNCAEIN